MDFLINTLSSAAHLAFSLDRELMFIVAVSMKVSITSTLIASIIGVPAGLLINFSKFRGKRFLITVLNTLLALPTVVIGLFVYSLISRRGIFGDLDLLYTQTAMIIGQSFLIIPVVTVLTITAVRRIDDTYRKTALTLGANNIQTAIVIIREARFAISGAVITAFGRVISEVGISMMLGGNARGFTRTMTTAMALEYDKGEFILSVALGIILLCISFMVNSVFQILQGKGR